MRRFLPRLALSRSRAFPAANTCHLSRSPLSSSSLGSVLVLSNLYPQPSASAAGVRTSYLLRRLCQDDDWTAIHYGTGAPTPYSGANTEVDNLAAEGVEFHSVPPNQSLTMKKLLDEIEDLSLVIFDRFYSEEAYSFHVYNHCPEVVRVVDMQDFHSLRNGRKQIVDSTKNDDFSWDSIEEVLHFVPSNDDSMLLRELASMHRSDLTLVCSPHEHDLLIDTYNIPVSKLCLAPFWVIKQQRETTPLTGWQERRDFVFIGNYRHAPNVDAVQQLRHVWPRIREQLPEVKLHVYGAFCSPSIQKFQNPDYGFLVHGFVDNLKDGLSDKRVMLAPLRYGAGIKGKIIDAWMFGLPVVMTRIASEGIFKSNQESVGGIVANTIDDFVNGAIRLYTNQRHWEGVMENIDDVLERRFSEGQFTQVSRALKHAVTNRHELRRNDYFGPLLWHQTTRSTEYFSRWIECKESKR